MALKKVAFAQVYEQANAQVRRIHSFITTDIVVQVAAGIV